MNPGWLVRRLRRMSPGEAAKRAREQARLLATIPATALGQNTWEHWSTGRLRVAPLPAPALDEAPEHARIYKRSVRLRLPIRWREGTTDRPWPRRHHALLSHHPGNGYGDVRPVWELHRLQFLPHLAASAPGRALTLLRDWLRQNPYRIGPAWMSAMEVAIRWISVHRTAAILGEGLPEPMARELDGLARASVHFLDHHPSTHSSAGNHLIVEALGMVWLAHALDPAPRGLLDTARATLTEQVLRQVRTDGSSIEGSFWYLGFVVDAIEHWLLLEPDAVPDRVKERLAAALELIAELTTPDGLYPDLADRDDGRIFRDHLDYDEPPFPGLLEVGALQLDRPEWRRRTPGAARRATWFFDGALPRRPRKPRVSAKLAIRTFEQAGWTQLRRGKGRAVLNHGPLGMPPTYGHGHAGALGLTLSWGETPLLVDPGTGAYNDDPQFRDHFRGTNAHNTVTLGDRDQAQALGAFLWRDGWSAQLDEHLDDGVTASCDAYVRSQGITHRRTVRWTSPRTLEVVDRFLGSTGQVAAGHWQLGPGCEHVELTPTGVVCHFGELSVEAVLPEGSWTVLRGELEPMRGWLAPRYGELVPAPVIRVSGRVLVVAPWRTVWKVRT